MADPGKQMQVDEQAFMKYYQGLLAKAKPGQPVQIIPAEYWRHLIGEESYQQQLTRAKKYNPHIEKQMNTPIYMGIVPEALYPAFQMGLQPKTDGVSEYNPAEAPADVLAYTKSGGVALRGTTKVPYSFNVIGSIRNPKLSSSQKAVAARVVLPHEMRHVLDQLRFSQEKKSTDATPPYIQSAALGLQRTPSKSTYTEYRAYAGDIITEANRLRRIAGELPLDPGGSTDPIKATLDLILDYEKRKKAMGTKASQGVGSDLGGQTQFAIDSLKEYLLQLNGTPTKKGADMLRVGKTSQKAIQEARQRFIDDLRKSISSLDVDAPRVSVQDGRYVMGGVV